MKTFLLDIIPKIEKYSQKLDKISLLTNQHWVSIDFMKNDKTVFIFRNNNELLISTNGKVEKAKWEYLGSNSILLDIGTESYLFKNGFKDSNILALKRDSSEEYAIFVNESKYKGELNSIDRVKSFLEQKYKIPKKMTLLEKTIQISRKKQKENLIKKQRESFKQTILILIGFLIILFLYIYLKKIGFIDNLLN